MRRSGSFAWLALAGVVALVGVVGLIFALGGSDGDEPEDSQIVWAVGDGAVAPEDAEVPRDLADIIAGEVPDRFLYLGDVYEDGTAEEFEENYDPLYGDLAPVTEPTPGDHEWGLRDEGYFPYWERARDRPLRPWYAVEVGEWEILNLNSQAPHDAGSEQLRWLRRHLASAPERCRIAMWHRPRYHAGLKPEYEDVDPLWETVSGEVVAVLSGDEHNMQRLRPRDGMVQFVAGSGGRELDDVQEEDPRLAFENDEEIGALRLELEADRLAFSFVAADGEMLDSGVLPCRN
ncbi:MAG: metallophosphoesterase family protein [Solirubrobacteraceae bacterium]